jgi:hypothetical protein
VKVSSRDLFSDIDLAGASIAGCFLRKFTQIRKCFPSDAGYVARRRTRMRAPLTLRRI